MRIQFVVDSTIRFIGRGKIGNGGLLRSEIWIHLSLHFTERTTWTFVYASLSHQTRAGQPFRIADHVRVDAVTKGLAGLARVVGYIFVLFFVYVTYIVETEIRVNLLVRFQIGNALNGKHHIREQLVEFSMLVFGGKWGRLGGQWGAREGVGVGVLLVPCNIYKYFVGYLFFVLITFN